MTAAERNSRLEADGFVVLDLLGPGDVRYLYGLCEKFLGGNQADFVSSSHILERQDSDFINAELHRILAEPMWAFFPGLQLLGGTLATKVPGNSVLVAHQDWSIVDEHRFRSYNLWIPLVDTGPANGTLGLIPGSHRWFSFPRGFGLRNPFEKLTAKLMRIGVEPELKAGQAILYDHALIHYSRPNRSGRPRHTAIVGMKMSEAALQLSLPGAAGQVDCYEAGETDFYVFDADRVQRSNRLLFTAPDNTPVLDWGMIVSAYRQHVPPGYTANVNGNGIWGRIRSLFG